jgi:DNA-binding NarL/FixJ family response regulator
MAQESRPDVARGRRSPNARTRIVVADRNVIVRAGLRAILERAPGVAVVADATTYEQVTLAVEEHGPDVLVIDLDLGDDTTRGLSLCEEVTERFAETRILVIADTLSELIVFEALRRGATGYLVKGNVTSEELVKSVRAVQEGDTAFGRGVGALVAKRLGEQRQDNNAISERELEVVRLVAQGLSNQQIAHELFISVSTVKFHIHNASRKLHAGRRAELVHRASAAGLL